MKDKLIEYSTAKLAKEKRFNIDCLNYYTLRYNKTLYIEQGVEYQSDRYIEFDWNLNKESSKQIKAPYPNDYHESQCSAPTQNLLRKWLREKHKIDISIIVNYNQHKQIKTYRCGIVYIKQLSDRQLIETFFIRPEGEKFLFIEFSTYEEALEKGLQEALKLI